MGTHADDAVFLKWVGGKRKSLPLIQAHLPPVFNSYYEPFLGGGAVYLNLIAPQQPAHPAHLGDANAALVSTFQAVQQDCSTLVTFLRQFAEVYNSLTPADQEAHYYAIRDALPRSPTGGAFNFLVINRLGFNGLYRTNAAGKVNVAWGKRLHYNPASLVELLQAAEARMGEAPPTFTVGDFEATLAGVSAGDLVYLDPPYVKADDVAGPPHRYTAGHFGLADHERLARCIHTLVERGAYVMLSQADTSEALDLYTNLCTPKVVRHDVTRVVGRTTASRKKTGELLMLYGYGGEENGK